MSSRWSARLAVAALASFGMVGKVDAQPTCAQPIQTAVGLFEAIEMSVGNPSALYQIYTTHFAPELQQQIPPNQFTYQTTHLLQQMGLIGLPLLSRRILSVDSSAPDGASGLEAASRVNAPGQVTQVQIIAASAFGRVQQVLVLRCGYPGWKVVGIWYNPA